MTVALVVAEEFVCDVHNKPNETCPPVL